LDRLTIFENILHYDKKYYQKHKKILSKYIKVLGYCSLDKVEEAYKNCYCIRVFNRFLKRFSFIEIESTSMLDKNPKIAEEMLSQFIKENDKNKGRLKEIMSFLNIKDIKLHSNKREIPLFPTISFFEKIKIALEIQDIQQTKAMIDKYLSHLDKIKNNIDKIIDKIIKTKIKIE